MCSVFFPYPVTFLLQLQARIHSPPHLKTHSVSHTSRWTTSLYCPWGCRCLLLFSVCFCLSSPRLICPSLYFSLLVFLPHSSSPRLQSLPTLTLQFHLVSSPPPSPPPTFPHFDYFLHVSLIVSPLPLFSKPLVIAPLSSPPLLTGTILHSAPSLAGWAVRVCVFVTFAFSLKQSRTR